MLNLTWRFWLDDLNGEFLDNEKLWFSSFFANNFSNWSRWILTIRLIEFNRSNNNFKSFVIRICSFDRSDDVWSLILSKRSLRISKSSWIRIKRWSFVRLILWLISFSSTGSNDWYKDSRWSNWELTSINSCLISGVV
jgi:hypothetical protein